MVKNSPLHPPLLQSNRGGGRRVTVQSLLFNLLDRGPGGELEYFMIYPETSIEEFYLLKINKYIRKDNSDKKQTFHTWADNGS